MVKLPPSPAASALDAAQLARNCPGSTCFWRWGIAACLPEASAWPRPETRRAIARPPHGSSRTRRPKDRPGRAGHPHQLLCPTPGTLVCSIPQSAPGRLCHRDRRWKEASDPGGMASGVFGHGRPAYQEDPDHLQHHTVKVTSSVRATTDTDSLYFVRGIRADHLRSFVASRTSALGSEGALVSLRALSLRAINVGTSSPFARKTGS